MRRIRATHQNNDELPRFSYITGYDEKSFAEASQAKRYLCIANNLVTSATDSITLAIGTNPGTSTLSGTASVAAVSGEATFSNLRLDKVGAGHTLGATATGIEVVDKIQIKNF